MRSRRLKLLSSDQGLIVITARVWEFKRRNAHEQEARTDATLRTHS